MNQKTDCIFCKIIEGTAPADIVYRDDMVTAFMDINPINPGHVLVIPNLHTPGLEGLPDAYGKYLFNAAQELAAALRRTDLEPDGINLILADGAAAGQEVFHLHLHVLARYNGDGFGFHRGKKGQPDEALPSEVASMLREALS